MIEAIEERLRDYVLAETREVFRKYGNLSSPAVLCALEERLSRVLGAAPTLLWPNNHPLLSHKRPCNRVKVGYLPIGGGV